MKAEEQENEVVAGGLGSWFRSRYTLIAWLAPIVTPIAFALLIWIELIEHASKLASGLLGVSVSPSEPIGMFIFGWIGLTLVCAGWIAWRSSRTERGATRIFVFLLVWAAATVLLGATGAGVGVPACMFAQREVRARVLIVE
jgi:hypothetical protein